MKLPTELEAAKDLISGLREQKNLINEKHTEEIGKLKKIIQADYDIIIILKHEIAVEIGKNNQLQNTTKEQINQKNDIIGKLIDLNSRINIFKEILDSDYQHTI